MTPMHALFFLVVLGSLLSVITSLFFPAEITSFSSSNSTWLISLSVLSGTSILLNLWVRVLKFLEVEHLVAVLTVLLELAKVIPALEGWTATLEALLFLLAPIGAYKIYNVSRNSS